MISNHCLTFEQRWALRQDLDGAHLAEFGSCQNQTSAALTRGSPRADSSYWTVDSYKNPNNISQKHVLFISTIHLYYQKIMMYNTYL